MPSEAGVRWSDRWQMGNGRISSFQQWLINSHCLLIHGGYRCLTSFCAACAVLISADGSYSKKKKKNSGKFGVMKFLMTAVTGKTRKRWKEKNFIAIIPVKQFRSRVHI